MTSKLRSPYVLGINFGGHDTSAALTAGGELIAACAQERYSLDKHSRKFPIDAINDCLSLAELNVSQIDQIAYCNDNRHLIRERYLRPALENDARIDFLLNDVERIQYFHDIENRIREETQFQGQICQYRHHLCHLASAYFPSGYDEALLVSYDGMGEWETGLFGVGKGGEITVVDHSNCFPHSLGLVYSAITFYLGWRHHCDEGIIMGLAPYGNPDAVIPESDRSYLSLLEEIIVETGRYAYEVDQSWMDYFGKRDKWISEKFLQLMGPKRAPDEEILQHHMDLAAALQQRLETVVLNQLTKAREEFGISRLALSGGVALNCSMNGKIEASELFDEIFVQPASGDDGTAIGGCYLAHQSLTGTLIPARQHNHYKGHRTSDSKIGNIVESSGLDYTKPVDLYTQTALHLNEGKIIAWFQGGAEFGPRALGNRSILARPFPAAMKDHINARVKFREYFRPFAGAVLDEYRPEYFDISQPSPHMLIACQVQESKQSEIPAVVHIDGSCRVQTVSKDGNPRFFQLITAFHAVTGIPVILNTSFNVKGQPIVNTPLQAIETFRSTLIDCLVLGDYLFEKEPL